MLIVQRMKKQFFPSLNEQLGHSPKDILVIVNIDDIGLHKDVTEASFKALNFGMVKTGSIMVPCPKFQQVVKLWRENPEIDLGIHLTLTSEWAKKYPWKPLLSQTDVPSLYSAEGTMWPSDESFIANAKQNDIEKELEAQINEVLCNGLKPSHLDHHMSIHQHPDYLPTVSKLSRKYRLPMNIPDRKKYKLPFFKNNLISFRKCGYVFPDTQVGIYKMAGQNLSLNYWQSAYHDLLRSLKPGVHLIKVHIAFQTEELRNITGASDSIIRGIDYSVWTSNATKKVAEDLGIIFIGYRPLQKLQESLMNSR